MVIDGATPGSHTGMAAAAGAGTPLGMDQGGTGTSHQRAAASSSTTSEETTRRASELLPAFIHEWYLLMDANLDHGERNLVVTALNGNFNPQRAGSCLRARLGDETSASSRATDKAEHWIRDAELMDGGYDMEAEGCDHEEIALIAEAETQAQEALATMNEARRTLKEVVKQNRKYFGDSGSRGSTSSQDRVRDDSILDCLRCGHRAATCPQKPAVVDDFLFRGKSGEPLWEAKLKATKGHFKWSDWEQVKFTQCGVVVEQRLIQGFSSTNSTTRLARRLELAHSTGRTLPCGGSRIAPNRGNQKRGGHDDPHQHAPGARQVEAVLQDEDT